MGRKVRQKCKEGKVFGGHSQRLQEWRITRHGATNARKSMEALVKLPFSRVIGVGRRVIFQRIALLILVYVLIVGRWGIFDLIAQN